MSFNETTTIIALVFAGGTALGTIGLALFALREIRRTSKEYRTRQLNEIIEWATSAREWDFTEEDDKRLKDSKRPWLTSWIIISHHIELLMSILRTGHIMYKVASNFKRPPFEENIKSLLTKLTKMRMHLIDLQKQIDSTATQIPPNFIAALDSAKAQQAQLRQAAENVIAEAAELI
jgi:hypothetical protein